MVYTITVVEPVLVDDLDPNWQRNQLYWATINYVRTWLTGDGLRLAAIKRNGGLLDSRKVRSIAVEYNVNRGIPKITNGRDVAAEGLASLLNRSVKYWPDGLVDRAKFCIGLVNEAREAGVFNDNQVSAISKFMWFLRPVGWTVFDQFAATGAGIPMVESRKRFIAFYSSLEDRKFLEESMKLQAVIKESEFSAIPATRILDSLLMARGGRGASKNDILVLKDFLSILPPPTRTELKHLAKLLQSSFGNRLLTIGTKQKMKKRGR